MNLTELYSRLSYGPLSNLSMGETTPGDITAPNKPKIVTHLNDALTKLHERFILREKAFVIRTIEGRMDYLLHKIYSTQGHTGSNPIYILDTVQDPFVEDIVCCLEAWDNTGRKLPLNDSSRDYSLFTPQADILQIPNQEPGAEISVSYQAYAVPIVLGSSTVFQIPKALEQALIYYIAGEVYSNLGSDNSSAKATEHYAKYEKICKDLEDKNTLATSNVSSTSRFDLNGWV